MLDNGIGGLPVNAGNTLGEGIHNNIVGIVAALPVPNLHTTAVASHESVIHDTILSESLDIAVDIISYHVRVDQRHEGKQGAPCIPCGIMIIPVRLVTKLLRPITGAVTGHQVAM